MAPRSASARSGANSPPSEQRARRGRPRARGKLVKLARCSDGGAGFWAIVDPDAGTAQPLAGGVHGWGPAFATDPSSALPTTGATLPLSDLQLLAPLEP